MVNTATKPVLKWEMTLDQYYKLAEKLYGADQLNWKFVCPVCRYEQSVKDYLDSGAPEGAVGFSCIGRYKADGTKAFGDITKDTGPCDYAGGGLFQLNPVKITDQPGGAYFALADMPAELAINNK